MPECLCCGIVVADFVCAPVAHLPAAGSLIMTEAISVAIGGCASNVAVDLCRLGKSVSVVGCVGSDVPGRFVREALADAGVDTKYVRESTALQTSATLVINVRGEDRRFIHTLGANGEFDGSEITPELVRTARVLYLGGFLLMPRLLGDHAARLFQMAREARVPTVLDVVIPDPRDAWRQLERVLPWTDVFVPNVDEARLITGLNDPREQAARFRSAGARTVVITCGGEGALLVDERQTLRAGKFPVDFIDGTGSGDAFAAGYIAGLLDGLPAERCLEFGSALGASCVRRAGATTGVFTRDELDAFLVEHCLPVERV